MVFFSVLFTREILSFRPTPFPAFPITEFMERWCFFFGFGFGFGLLGS